jgi:homoserine kinase
VEISVPASTSNLGPAQDGLGLALDLRLEVALGPASPDKRDERGTEYLHSLLATLSSNLGDSQPVVVKNEIPYERGLGGSGAIRLAAVLVDAASRLEKPSSQTVLQIAARLEQHPDNVAASLLGGCVASALEPDGSVSCLRVEGFEEVAVALAIPELAIHTEAARRILPAQIPHADARYNTAHAAVLVAAISQRRYDLLEVATRDRLHQKVRLSVIPGGRQALARGLEAGAYGTFLSGSGSSLAAIAPPAEAAAIAQAMVAALADFGTPAIARVPQIDFEGSSVKAYDPDGRLAWEWRWRH